MICTVGEIWPHICYVLYSGTKAKKLSLVITFAVGVVSMNFMIPNRFVIATDLSCQKMTMNSMVFFCGLGIGLDKKHAD